MAGADQAAGIDVSRSAPSNYNSLLPISLGGWNANGDSGHVPSVEGSFLAALAGPSRGPVGRSGELSVPCFATGAGGLGRPAAVPGGDGCPRMASAAGLLARPGADAGFYHRR